MIIHTASCALLLLSVGVVYSQERSVPVGLARPTHRPVAFANPADSMDYVHFMNGLQHMDLGTSVEGSVSGYRLVWITSEHGGMIVASCGNGSAPALREKDLLSGAQEFALPFRTSEGKRGLSVVSDIPCGLICRTVWYYVEE